VTRASSPPSRAGADNCSSYCSSTVTIVVARQVPIKVEGAKTAAAGRVAQPPKALSRVPVGEKRELEQAGISEL
jgi:hypothetical protein